MIRSLLASFLVLAVSVWLPLDALARAGGGGGGGHGGKGGGLFQLIAYAVLLPVLVVLQWWRNKRTREKAAATADAMKRMGVKDPAWDEERLRSFVKTSFMQIQHAWCAQDLAALRPLLGDAIMSEWTAKIEGYRERGVRNVMDKLRVERIRFVEAEDRPGAADDRFTAEITASAADYALDASGAVCKLEPGDEEANTERAVDGFIEFWTYRRSAAGWTLERVDQDDQWRRSVNAAIVEEDSGR
jgi:hypothetical protein